MDWISNGSKVYRRFGRLSTTTTMVMRTMRSMALKMILPHFQTLYRLNNPVLEWTLQPAAGADTNGFTNSSYWIYGNRPTSQELHNWSWMNFAKAWFCTFQLMCNGMRFDGHAAFAIGILQVLQLIMKKRSNSKYLINRACSLYILEHIVTFHFRSCNDVVSHSSSKHTCWKHQQGQVALETLLSRWSSGGCSFCREF